MNGHPAEVPTPSQEGDGVDETALLDRLRRGENRAFEEVIRRHGAPLLATARRILVNSEEAQDALQEAFLAAFRSIEGFQRGARLSTWLHRIVVNASLLRLRKQKRRREESIEPLLPGFRPNGHLVAPPRPWTEPPESVLQREELRQLVRDYIDDLPDKYRLVLLLRDIEGLDTETTAELMGLSAGAVKTRLHRARQALRSLLDLTMQRGG